jgi:hypothetical protein
VRGAIDEKRSGRLDRSLEKLPGEVDPQPTRLRDLTDFHWDAFYTYYAGVDGRTIRLRTGHQVYEDDERYTSEGDLLVFTNGPKLAAVLSISEKFSYKSGDKYTSQVLVVPSDGHVLLDLQEPNKARS